ADGTDRPVGRLRPFPRARRQTRALAADDPRPGGQQHLPGDARVSCLHAGRAAGGRDDRGGTVAAIEPDPLQPRPHPDTGPEGARSRFSLLSSPTSAELTRAYG